MNQKSDEIQEKLLTGEVKQPTSEPSDSSGVNSLEENKYVSPELIIEHQNALDSNSSKEQLSLDIQRRKSGELELANIPNTSFQHLRLESKVNQLTGHRATIREKKTLVSDQIELQQSVIDHIKILLYNFIEPFLVVLSLSVCLQLPMVSGLVYISITLIGIVPAMLSGKQGHIKCKRYLAIFMLLITVISLGTKGVYYHDHQTNPDLLRMFGIWTDQAFKTFAIDLAQFVISTIFIFHQQSQLAQAIKREKLEIKKQDYQIEIKLLHPVLGRKHSTIYVIAILLYLSDCFALLTLVQLWILLCIVFSFLMLLFSAGHWKAQQTRTIHIRVMQVFVFLQIIAIYVLQLPLAFQQFRTNNSRLLSSFGVFGLEDNQTEIVSVRVHLMLASSALIMTEIYIKALEVLKISPTKTLMEDKHIVSDMFRMSKSGLKNKSTLNVERPSNFKQSRIRESKPVKLSQLNVENSEVKSEDNSNKSMLARLANIWSVLETSTIRWLCRLFSFVWIYMYHDWQSVILLVWLLHSTCYRQNNFFRNWILYFYLPYYIVAFLWYYSINIKGIILWNNIDQADLNMAYNYGFYEMQIPCLETSFMFINVYFLAILAVSMDKSKELDDKAEVQKLMNKITHMKSPTIYQLLFLGLVHIEFPLMLVLIIAGLDQMDVYHIALLIFFVAYTLYSEKLKNFPLYLLIYLDLFVLEKYIYTLAHSDFTYEPTWMHIMGFSTSRYDPNTPREYFRYMPAFDQWILVFLSFCLYRRASVIGSEKIQVDQQEKKCKAILAIKYPTLYRVALEIDIVWNYFIVVTTFVILLTIVVSQQRTLINASQQLLILILLCVYFAAGLKSLIHYWEVLIASTAIVLTLEIIYQFMQQTGIFKEIKTRHPYWTTLPPWYWELQRAIGFYYLGDTPTSLFFLPYILLFALSTVMYKRLKIKQALEEKQIQFEEDDIMILTEENFTEDNSEELFMSMRQKPKVGQTEIRRPLDQKQLLLAEYRHLTQWLEMRYKISFLLYKLRWCWPALDLIASYFVLILSTAVLCFAIYKSLAVIWGLLLLVFMIQTILSSNTHYQFRRKERKRFNDQVKENKKDEFFDANAIKEYQRDKSNPHKSSSLNLSNSELKQQSEFKSEMKASELEIADQQREEKIQKLKVEDEIAISEWNRFLSTKDKATVKIRHYFWATQYIMITISLTLIYLFSFALLWDQIFINKPQYTEIYNKIIFAAFLGGCFTDISHNDYSNDASPFYVVLMLLIMEKCAQYWILEKFGCNEEIVKQFDKMVKLHQEYKKTKDLRKQQQMKAQAIQDRKTAIQDRRTVTMGLKTRPKELLLPIVEEAFQSDKQSDLFEQNQSGSRDKVTREDVQLILSSQDEIKGQVTKTSPERFTTLEALNSSRLTALKVSILHQEKDSPILDLTKRKEELMNKIKQKFTIQTKLTLLYAAKTILEDVIVLMVWVSCIYKQNILSILLFLVLAIFTFTRTGFSVLLMRYTVVIVFVLQYFAALACLSSYNSPVHLPQSILVNGIYPNADHLYFFIPIYFGYQQITNQTITNPSMIQPANLRVADYLGFPADSHQLNGMWIDYTVIILVMVYFNLFNFWLLFTPTEIQRSSATNEDLKEYVEISKQLQQNGSERKRKLTVNRCISDFEQQFGFVRTSKSLENFLFTYYHLFMIAFLLAVSIFNGSLLSFGYFLACMYLISDQKNLLTEYKARTRMQKLLKYFLIPYLLFDIGLNLLFQVPISFFQKPKVITIANIIGLEQIWQVSPEQLEIGQVVIVQQTHQFMTSYMMKGLTFFFISTMLQILSSHDFQQFQDETIKKLASNQDKIGRGLAYRFNNFKCHSVLHQAKEVEVINKMLAHVKKLIKKRDKLYNVAKSSNTVDVRRKNNLETQQIIKEEVSGEDSDKDNHKFNREKFEKEEQIKVKEIFEQKINKLPCCHKFYLYLRRNFVIDIFFRYSEEHLDDIVNQLYEGRTSIKSKLEIGKLYEARQQYLEQVEEERREIKEIEEAKHQVISADVEEEEVKYFRDSEPSNQPAKLIQTDNSQSEYVKPSSTFEHLYPQEKVDRKPSQLLQIEEEKPSRRSSVPQLPVPTNEEELAIQMQKKRLLQQSDKPWEKVELTNSYTYSKMFTRFFVLLWKMIISYGEFFCYFWMLVATISNGGTLYLVYPIAIFGYAILLEERPGKWFWYGMLAFTQLIIIANFTLMLTLWSSVFSTDQIKQAETFFNSTNLGFKDIIVAGDWWLAFKQLIPEIMVIVSIMILIMNQTLAGVLGVPFREFETFEKGLMRYRLNISSNEQEKNALQHAMAEQLAIQTGLNLKEIKQAARRRCYSEPVGRETDVLKNAGWDLKNNKNADKDKSSYFDEDDLELINQNLRTRSVDALQIYAPKSEQNLFQKAKGIVWNASSLLWDNNFFEKLFPLVKQQKPGIDFYVWLFLIEFTICLYILFFFTSMIGQQSNIASQFFQNQFSSGMVITLFVMIFVMIIDRIIYSTHTFLTFSDTPQTSESEQASGNQAENSGENYGINEQISVDTQTRSRQLSIQTSDLGNKNDINSGHPFQTHSWLENTMSIKDEDSENEIREFKNALVPQKQQKRASRVLRIYFLWALLILVHWFIFIRLPQTIEYCYKNPQTKDGQPVNYPSADYKCNTFTNNASLQIFYVLWIMYFTLAGYQVQVGLPELRKGSFMVGQYDLISCYTFRAYMAVPFIFELRTIIDWTFTTTSLDVFQWIKLARVQADFYVNMCINAGYFSRKLGELQSLFFKVVQGFFLMVFVLALLVGPILLFSTINPVGQVNYVDQGALSFVMNLQNQTNGAESRVELFATSQLSQIRTMTENQYESCGFQNYTQTNLFPYSQTQIVQFTPSSDTVWTISPPKKEELLQTLTNVQNGNNTDVLIQANFVVRFGRQNGASETQYNYTAPLNTTFSETQWIIGNLTNAIQCNKNASGISAADPIVTQFPQMIVINQRADQSAQLSPLNTNNIFTTGFNLSYYCNETLAPNDPNSYWEMSQQFFPIVNQTVDQTNVQQYVNTTLFPGSGFGFFVFSQKVLPSYLSQYAASILVFYISVVYVVASLFRSAFVPQTAQIFITDAPFNEDILMICQSIHIYRVQSQYDKEEELYMILIDIMRSPEMIKSICGSSLKRKLQ